MAKRLAAMATTDLEAGRNAGRKAAYLKVINQFGRWNGDVFLDHNAVSQPLHWTAPRTIFVNSMSDLFHDDVPDEFIVRVFNTMNKCPHHTFQILTKRPRRVSMLSP